MYAKKASQVAVKRICLPVEKRQETQVLTLRQEDPLVEDMAIHSSIPAWEISWTEESGGLQKSVLAPAL